MDTKKELGIVLEFIPTNRDELIPKLVDGYGDIAAAGLTITDQRRRLVDFTLPYLSGVNEVVVTHKGAAKLSKIEDLAGLGILVRKSSSYYESLLALNKKLIESGKQAVRIITVDESLETEDILELVNTGAIELTVCDSHLANIWAGVHSNLVVCEDLKLRTGGNIAWMIRKKSPQLMGSLNAYIKNNKKGTLLENNVHAGVKYLAFLRRRYFSDPQIQPRNQVRFALAAYNAGPAKISRTRSQAKEICLDPNRWFRNVELAALKKIGQETVRYVSNINKYYVIYQHGFEQSEAREKEKTVIEKKAK